jgi:hypothetical protein
LEPYQSKPAEELACSGQNMMRAWWSVRLTRKKQGLKTGCKSNLLDLQPTLANLTNIMPTD